MTNLLQQFKAQYIPQYVKIALEAYKENNPEIQLIDSPEEFMETTQKLVRILLEIEEKFNRQNKTDIMFNNAVFQDGKLVAALFTCDLHYYIRKVTGKINDELLKELSVLNLNQIPERSIFVGMKTIVRKGWQNKSILSRCVEEKSLYMKRKNYTHAFSHIVNPFSIKISEKVGATIWKNVSFELKGKKLNRYIVLRDLRRMADPKL